MPFDSNAAARHELNAPRIGESIDVRLAAIFSAFSALASAQLAHVLMPFRSDNLKSVPSA